MRLLALILLTCVTGVAPALSAPTPPSEQHVIVRIRTYSSISTFSPIRWKEHHGPKCIRVDALGGAAVTQPNSVDLALRGGQFVRARFEKMCQSHDFFYSGFYLTPSPDGQVCVGRDVVHARIGGDCMIVKFRRLEMHK